MAITFTPETIMTKDTFWQLVDIARLQTNSLEDLAAWIKINLINMGVEQSKMFDILAHSYIGLARKDLLWIVADIIKDGCTDDGFEDFLGWLIVQGKEVYFNALKDPDTLAKIDIQHDKIYGTAEFCDLQYLGESAYENLTGTEIEYDKIWCELCDATRSELEQDIVYADNINADTIIPDTCELLPNICHKYITE